jgi:hypothetical protein
MASKVKFIDMFLCDDVRQEISGKTTLVGVYGSDVIVPAIPIMLPQMFIITKWDITDGIFREVTFRIGYPNGNQIGPLKAVAPDTVIGSRLTMNLALIPFQIQTAGVHKVYMAIDEEPEEMVGEFEIKVMPPNQAVVGNN